MDCTKIRNASVKRFVEEWVKDDPERSMQALRQALETEDENEMVDKINSYPSQRELFYVFKTARIHQVLWDKEQKPYLDNTALLNHIHDLRFEE